MKEIALVPFVVVLAACASHEPKTTAASSTAPISRSVTDPSGIRLAEQIREYRFGRYVDPGDPLVMHDAHPVYRVEQTAAWNLRPDTENPIEADPARCLQAPDQRKEMRTLPN